MSQGFTKKKTIITTLILLALASLVVFTAYMIMQLGKTDSTSSSATQKSYLALGDSVAAGFGLEGADGLDYCDRTLDAYPQKVATTLKLKLTTFACSGAKASEGLLTAQTVGDHMIAPQLDRLYAQNTPALLTMTAGVNDLDWTKILATCYSSICGTQADTVLLQSRLETMRDNLTKVFDSLQTHYASTPPEVLVTSYYQLFPDKKKDCSSLSGVEQDEIDWWRNQTTAINKVVQDVTKKYSFVTYVPVDFSGHELCQPSSWVQDVTSSGAFHPTSEGQVTIAKAIEKAYTK